MLDAHLRFHSANGKRLILIVDDEAINREMLGGILEDKYEIIFAEPGSSTSTRKGSEKFAYDALHDPVTGLYNASAYEMLLKDADQDHIALMLICVDDYKDICKLVAEKIDKANEMLSSDEDGLPPIALSAGLAFADRENPMGDLFHDAERALHNLKDTKTIGCGIFE